MKTLLKLLDTGYSILFLLVIFISSFITFYFYKKITILENSLIEQGKILQKFILNYNNTLISNKSFNNHMYSNNINTHSTNFDNNNDNYNYNHNDNDNNNNDNDDNDNNNIMIIIRKMILLFKLGARRRLLLMFKSENVVVKLARNTRLKT